MEVVPKHSVTQRRQVWPGLSVEPENDVLSFRVTLEPRSLFSPFQFMSQA